VHLFEAIEATVAENRSVADNLALMMRSWTTTPGYPVVRVNRTYDSVGTTLISQERFLSSDEDTTGYLYHVPLNFAKGSNPDFVDTEPTHWLSSEQNLITVNIIESDWLIFNKQQFGYYRVNYDLKNWAFISSQLSGPGFRNIHALNRAQLIDDSHYLARSGQLPLKVALEILSYLHQETDLTPLRAAMDEIQFVVKKFAGHEQYSELRQYLHGTFEAIYNNVKASSMSEYYRQLTLIEISDLACKFGVSACTAEAMKQFRVFV
jgi:aminopeptidase N